MVKIALPVLLVLLGAIIWVVFWLGKRAGQELQKKAQGAIDPTTYYEMADFVRLVLGAQPVDDPAYIPEWMKEQGQPVLKKIGTARRAIR